MSTIITAEKTENILNQSEIYVKSLKEINADFNVENNTFGNEYVVCTSITSWNGMMNKVDCTYEPGKKKDINFVGAEYDETTHEYVCSCEISVDCVLRYRGFKLKTTQDYTAGGLELSDAKEEFFKDITWIVDGVASKDNKFNYNITTTGYIDTLTATDANHEDEETIVEVYKNIVLSFGRLALENGKNAPEILKNSYIEQWYYPHLNNTTVYIEDNHKKPTLTFDCIDLLYMLPREMEFLFVPFNYLCADVFLEYGWLGDGISAGMFSLNANLSVGITPIATDLLDVNNDNLYVLKSNGKTYVKLHIPHIGEYFTDPIRVGHSHMFKVNVDFSRLHYKFIDDVGYDGFDDMNGIFWQPSNGVSVDNIIDLDSNFYGIKRCNLTVDFNNIYNSLTGIMYFKLLKLLGIDFEDQSKTNIQFNKQTEAKAEDTNGILMYEPSDYATELTASLVNLTEEQNNSIYCLSFYDPPSTNEQMIKPTTEIPYHDVENNTYSRFYKTLVPAELGVHMLHVILYGKETIKIIVKIDYLENSARSLKVTTDDICSSVNVRSGVKDASALLYSESVFANETGIFVNRLFNDMFYEQHAGSTSLILKSCYLKYDSISMTNSTGYEESNIDIGEKMLKSENRYSVEQTGYVKLLDYNGSVTDNKSINTTITITLKEIIVTEEE